MYPTFQLNDLVENIGGGLGRIIDISHQFDSNPSVKVKHEDGYIGTYDIWKLTLIKEKDYLNIEEEHK